MNTEEILKKLRLYVLQDKKSTDLDEVFESMIDDVTVALMSYLEKYTLNETERKSAILKYPHVIVECVILRYNRLGSEGYQSETVEGHRIYYPEAKDMFSKYDDLFENYFESLGHNYDSSIRYW